MVARLALWRLAWEFFQAQPWPTQLFGLGLGSSRVWLPYLKLQTEGVNSAELSLWMHNDWSQIFFELGFIGCLLAIAAFLTLLWDSSHRNQALLLGYAVAMGANMPLHWTLLALPLWVVLREETLC